MPDLPELTRAEAQALVESLSLSSLFEDESEVDLLEAQNPTLLRAYATIWAIASGDEA
jgi:hypothetical protein